MLRSLVGWEMCIRDRYGERDLEMGSCQGCHDDEPDDLETRQTSGGAHRSQEEFDAEAQKAEELELVQKLRAVDGNTMCADCDAPLPLWANIVHMSKGQAGVNI
eukprot:TRINITY_DN23761_c0_g1_i1.p4 TRINITY_DN23761_c0_g1~~TRINITY_DN23761_c0_g1_i1.p4  ORF type:complete len:104 (+),score=34.42 TRINITY_DN23761_c0_g1_i1:106-417(+)